MTIEPTKDQEALVGAQLATGRYGSRAEVVAEALEPLSDYAQLEQIKLERLRAEIQKGLGSERTLLDVAALKAEAWRRHHHGCAVGAPSSCKLWAVSLTLDKVWTIVSTG